MRLLVALAVSAAVFGQVPVKDMICVANKGIPPTLRTEGLTERVGDLLLQCTGGTPTPTGSVVPTYNITLTLNFPVTNARDENGVTDALLLIDEPNTPSAALGRIPLINFVSAPLTPLVTPTVTGVGPGAPSQVGSTYDGLTNHGNAFQGLVDGSNKLVWLGVPIDPPSTNGTRLIRITNARANVEGPTLAQVLAFLNISPNDSSSPNVVFPTDGQVVGTVQPGLIPDVTRTFTRQHCQPTNFPFPATPDPNNVATLIFQSAFPGSFKTRSTAQGTDAIPFPPPPAQNVPGQDLSLSELGFNLPGVDPPVNSQVSTGTRLEADFSNVPDRFELWVQRRSVTPNGHVAILKDTSEFGVKQTQGEFANLIVNNNTARAVWEVILTNSSPATFAFNVHPSFNSDNTIANSPTTGNTTVNLSFAPLASIREPIVPVGSAVLPIPRFFDGPSFTNGVNLPNPLVNRFGIFSLTPCNVNPGLSGVLPPGSPPSRVAFFGAQGEDPIAPQNFIFTSLRNPVTSGLSVVPNASATQVPAAPLEGGGERGVTSNWLTVTTSSTSLPQTAKISVNPAGLAPGKYTGTIAFTASGVGTVNLPVDFTLSPPLPFFTPAAVTSAGSYASGIVTPGEAVVIFGKRFGPPTLAGLDFAGGQVGTLIGETRVLFDGVPAPMIYAVNGQVSAFVPYAVAANPRTSIQVEYKGVKSNPVIVPVLKAVPALLTSNSSGSGQAAALNQDNSFNLPGSGAAVGNQVVLFGVGGGQTTPAGRDGRLNGVGGTLPTFNMPITSVTINGKAAEVKFAGPAPGAVEGVFQVNVVVPPGTPPGPAFVVVKFGDYVTQPGVTITVK